MLKLPRSFRQPGGLLLLFILCCSSLRSQVVTHTFYAINATQVFELPYCASDITVAICGASGGGGNLAPSAAAICTVVMTNTPGQLLYLNVGSSNTGSLGGWNGGGNGGVGTNSIGGGGGGASDIRLGNNALSSRIIVMGGSGGNGSYPWNTMYGGDASVGSLTTCGTATGQGGVAGWGASSAGLATCAGGTNTGYGGGGGGGGLSGPGGPTGSGAGGYGQAGSLGQGGNGGGATSLYGGSEGGLYGAGGGGGGYYGGAGGMCGAFPASGTLALYSCGGGGAGSSYINMNIFSNLVPGGTPTGNGFIKLSYSYTSPAVAVAGTPSTCTGGSITLNATGVSTYTWFPLGSFGGSNNASIAITPPASAIYTVAGTNTAGCISYSMVNVQVRSYTPSITILNSTLPSGICPGSTASLTASGATNYTWTGGVTNGIGFTAGSAQSYTVTGFNGCGTGSAVTSLSLHPLPTLVATPSQTTICNGQSVAINVSGAANYTFTNNSVIAGQSFTPPISSGYTVMGTSVQGCTGSASTSITVLNYPSSPPNVFPGAICAGSTATLTAGAAQSYTWLPVNLSQGVITVSPQASTIYTLIQANANCADTRTISVTVINLPTVTAGSSTTLACQGSTLLLTATGAGNYNWYGPQGFLGNGAQIQLNLQQSGSYSVQGTSNGCNNTSAVTLSMLPSPTVQLGLSSNTLCTGETLTLSASGALTYTWSGLTSSTNIAALVVQPGSTVSVTGSSNNCSASALANFTVYPLPPVLISTSNGTLCGGKSSTLIAQGAAAYTWQPAGQLTPSIVVSPASNTIYTVTGSSALGCRNSNTFSITVYNTTLNMAHTGSCCAGDTYSIQLSGAGGYSLNGLPTLPLVSLSPTTSTAFTITASSNFNGLDCRTSATDSIRVFSLPLITFSYSNNRFCMGEHHTVYASGASTYTWSNLQTGPQFTFVAQPPLMSFSVNGSSSKGCVSSTSTVIAMNYCVGLSQNENNSFQMYPNPAHAELFIRSDRSQSIELHDVTGQLILSAKLETGTSFVPLPVLAPGIYLVREVSSSVCHKLVIE